MSKCITELLYCNSSVSSMKEPRTIKFERGENKTLCFF